jgi:WD40 repeat protein
MFFYPNPNDASALNVAVFADNKVQYFANAGAKNAVSKVAVDTLPFSGQPAVVALSSDGDFFACSPAVPSANGSSCVFICDLATGKSSGGRVLKERKRCAGQWGKITSLSFSEDDSTLLASDDSGVLYVWDVRELEPRAALELDADADADAEEDTTVPSGTPAAVSGNDISFLVDAKESIKLLSSAEPAQPVPEPPAAASTDEEGAMRQLAPAQVMTLVVDEMLRRTWISSETAATMVSPDCPQHAVLEAAIEAFLVNQDFEELLDTFLITSRHVEEGGGFEEEEDDLRKQFEEDEGGEEEEEEAGEKEADEEEEEDEDDEEEEEEEDDEALASMTMPNMSLNMSVNKSQASGADHMFNLQKIAGFSSRAPLLWNQSSGLLAYSMHNSVVMEDIEEAHQSFATHAPSSFITSFDISTDGQYLVTGSTASEDSLQVWSTIRTQNEHALEDMLAMQLFDDVGVLCVAFCQNDEIVVAVAGGEDGQKLLLWDFLKPSSIARVFGLSAATLCLAPLSKCLPAFATGGEDGVYLWTMDDDRAYNDGTPRKLTQRAENADDCAVPENRLADIPVRDGELVTSICQHHKEPNIVFAATAQSSIFMYAMTTDAVLRSWANMTTPVAVTTLQHKASGLFAEAEGVISLWSDDDRDYPKSVVSVDGGSAQMQWDDDGVEGVVGTCDGCVKYIKLGSGGADPLEDDIELIKGDPVDACAFSPDSKLICTASSAGIIVFESSTLKPVTKCKTSAKSDSRATSVAFGSTSLEGSFLVAAAFSDWTVQVVRVMPRARREGCATHSFMLPRSAEFESGVVNIAFVDHDNYLAVGDDAGELSLWPIEISDDSCDVAVKRECFDLMAHEKIDGKFDDVNWRWTSLDVHSDDSTTWCCTKLVKAEDGTAVAQLYVFQQGVNSHIVSVLDTFSSENCPTPDPSNFVAKFSVTDPGTVVCALGQAESSCVIVYNMLDESGKPVATNIVQLDHCVVSLEVGHDDFVGCGFDDGRVFVMTESECEPLDTMEMGNCFGFGKGRDLAVGCGEGLMLYSCGGGEVSVEADSDDDDTLVESP